MVLRFAWLGLLLSCVISCGEVADDQPRLTFALDTDFTWDTGYEAGGIPLVASHEQTLFVELTSKGLDDISNPEELTYRIQPIEGTSISAVKGMGRVPDVKVLVQNPGSYKIQAISRGQEVDSLTLTFERLASLELFTRVRPPGSQYDLDVSYEQVSMIREGTRAVFVPLPHNAQGERLGGRVVVSAAAEPPEAVSHSDVTGVEDQGLSNGNRMISLSFMAPGPVTITVTEAVTNTKVSHRFEVTSRE